MIDTNAYFGQWPFRRLAGDSSAKNLSERLQRAGLEKAWVSSYEGLLHRDIGGVNLRLAEACKGLPLIPFGVVNPRLPDWQEDLRRCQDEYQMPGIRLFPNYHNYLLSDPVFRELLELASSRRLIVQIALKMEDERTQHALMQVRPVDPQPLAKLLNEIPAARCVLVNSLSILRGQVLSDLMQTHRVWVETAMLEAVEGITVALKSVPANRLLLGTNAPFFIAESAVLKLQESDLGQALRQQIAVQNAEELLNASL